VIEDGGETVAGSLLFWFAARVAHVQMSATARPVDALQTERCHDGGWKSR
jgi:hypothetical protein